MIKNVALAVLLTLFFAWPLELRAAPPFPQKMQEELNRLVGVQGRTYTSNGAIDVILDEYLSNRPARMTPRDALNQVFSNARGPILNTSAKTTICWVVDDNNKEWWNGVVGTDATPIRTVMKANGQKVGFSVGAYHITRQDTTTNLLSKWNLINMRNNDGAEIGSGGWDELTTNGWFHQTTGKLAKGNYTQAELTTYMTLHFTGNVLAIRDTIGIGPVANWHSASNSSSSDITIPFARAAGFDYMVSSTTTTSSSNNRQNELYQVDAAHWGIWGTGGAKGKPISAIPGVHNSPYEIMQSLAESSDTSDVYKTVRRALQTKGLIVFNLHRATTSETNLQGANGFKAFCQYLKTLIDQGRLQCLTPSEAFKIYYQNSWAPTINFGTKNFDDLDGDTHLDMWFSGNGTAAVGDTALLNPFSSVVKYGGLKTMRLNWPVGSAVFPGGLLTADSTWERGNAVKAVFPPAGAGWTAIAEMRAICDTGVASGTNPNTKYIGMCFYAAIEGNSYQYAVSGAPSVDNWYQSAAANRIPWQASVRNVGSAGDVNRPGTWYTFSDDNRLNSGNAKWLFVTSSFDLPADCDYLFINVFKHTAFPVNEVIITDPVVRFYNRYTGEVVPQWPQ